MSVSKHRFTTSFQGRYTTHSIGLHPFSVNIPLKASVYDILAGSVSHSKRFTTSLQGRISHYKHRFTTSLEGRYPTLSIGLRHPCRVGIPLQTVYGIFAGSVSTPNGLRHSCMVGIPLPESVYDIGAGSVSYSKRFTASLEGWYPTHSIGLRHPCRVDIPLYASIYDICAG